MRKSDVVNRDSAPRRVRRASSSLRRRRSTVVAVVALLSLPLIPSVGAAATSCNGLPATHFADPAGGTTYGTGGDDVIIGTSGADRILGRGGNDTICGLGGRDEIRGGTGDDWIHGGAGADRVYGQAGNDTLNGGGGPDTLVGNRGADQMRGHKGNDVLSGGAGNDTVFGNAGTDRLNAGSGVDVCDGEQLANCEIADVSPGDSGRHVTYLQQHLSQALLYRGPIDGVYPNDPATLPKDLTAAVYAFHKLHQDPSGDSWTSTNHVSAEWTLADWDLLETFDSTVPVVRVGEPDRFEVDAYHEVMWLILDDEVAGIFHVSVGGEFTYTWNGAPEVAHTPRGDLDVDHYWPGHRYGEWMYRAWYYKYTHRWMALHGYYTVPPYPASHGCVRVTYDDADWIYARVGIADGWPFHIWDE